MRILEANVQFEKLLLIMLRILVSSLALLLSSLINGEVDQCQADCREPTPFRLVGPTRPWYSGDQLGNELRLTKFYPFSIAGSAVENVRFNLTFGARVDINQTLVDNRFVGSGMEAEKEAFLGLVKETLNSTDQSFHLEILDSSIRHNKDGVNVTSSKLDMIIQIDIPILDNSDHTIDDIYLQNLESALTVNISSSDFVSDEYGGYNTARSVEMSAKIDSGTLHAGDPNPFSRFCELGCSFFFSSTSDPLHINECTDKCDDFYKYNITVGYNDLLEVARLECRDGCQIGLKRCQPGYCCSQVRLKKDPDGEETVIGFDGGLMAHCPAGTYRDVAYEAVEECILCPPGRFREDIKGRSLGGCNKCPTRTYNSNSGSSTIKDCLRCPAGTFTNEPGSATCTCIIPSACENEFPSPADAEKRNTVPFIGRW